MYELTHSENLEYKVLKAKHCCDSCHVELATESRIHMMQTVMQSGKGGAGRSAWATSRTEEGTNQ